MKNLKTLSIAALVLFLAGSISGCERCHEGEHYSPHHYSVERGHCVPNR
ncbi:MAG: hypothetical protein ACR2PJ_00685 [Pseudomonadales bacterium]